MLLGYKGAGCLVFYYDTNSHKVYVLLGKRISGVGKNQWSIPGGGWEPSDGFSTQGVDFRATARRELYEETFLRLKLSYYLTRIWYMHTPGFNYEVFAVRLANKNRIQKWTEFRELKWFRIDRLPDNLFWAVPRQIRGLLEIMNKKGYILS